MVTEARNAVREKLGSAKRAPLDWLNFLLGNVKDGLGPFLAIFLMSSEHWDAGSIGVVLTICGLRRQSHADPSALLWMAFGGRGRSSPSASSPWPSQPWRWH